jgi:hypothetical protein
MVNDRRGCARPATVVCIDLHDRAVLLDIDLTDGAGEHQELGFLPDTNDGKRLCR